MSRARPVPGLAAQVVVLAFGVLGSFPSSANADPAAPVVRVSGALFQPSRTDDGITWDAHWILAPETPAEVEDGAPRVLRFALPLQEGETLDPAPGISGITENGHLAGIRFERSAINGRTLHAVVRQPVGRHESRVIRLGAPIASGTALQIVDANLGGGTTFEIETGGVVERRVGHLAPPGVSRAAREEAKRLTGYDAHFSSATLYVRGDDVKAPRGLEAAVVTPRARGKGGAIVVGLGFAAVVAALLLAMKRLRHQASVEHADAVLAAEVDALPGER